MGKGRKKVVQCAVGDVESEKKQKRRKTNDGMTIYSAEELGINNANAGGAPSSYKIGDFVDITGIPSFVNGVHKLLHRGFTGKITKVTETHVRVYFKKRVGKKRLPQSLTVPMKHVRLSRARFLKRKLLKRQPDGPLPGGYMVPWENVETILPYDI